MYQPLGNVPTGMYISKRPFLHNRPLNNVSLYKKELYWSFSHCHSSIQGGAFGRGHSRPLVELTIILTVPSSYPAAYQILPLQNLAVRGKAQNKINPTQVRDQMPHPVYNLGLIL